MTRPKNDRLTLRTRLLSQGAAAALAIGLLAAAGSASAQSECSGTQQTGQTGDADLDRSQTACGNRATTFNGAQNVAVGYFAFANDGVGHIAIGGLALADGVSATPLDVDPARANTVVGYNAKGRGDASGNTVLGSRANGSGGSSQNVAIGTGAASFGFGSTNIAIGAATAAGDGTSKVAVGDSSVAGGANSVAMGYNARANGNFSVAIGAGSTADGDFTFSVGSAANRRRIANVLNGAIAAGSSDAVTGDQLYATNQRVSALEAGNANALGVAQAAQADADAAQATADQARTEAAGARNQALIARSEAAAAQTTANLAIERGDDLGASVASALGGGSSYDQVNGVVTAPTYVIGTSGYNSVGSALEAVNTTGTRYFRTDGTLGAAQATGAGSTAIGGESTASGARSLAAGPNATASGASALAFGDTARATAAGALAMGRSSSATGVNAIAIGTGATATGSVAIGAGATASNGGAAFGDGAVATGLNATATGPGAQALAANSVAIGSGSVATQANTVSMGVAGGERRLTNVASGTAATDAVNVAQLGASGASVAAALGGGATADASGRISAPRYALYMGTFDNVGSALDAVSHFASDSRLEARRGIAAAMAMSTAPMPSAAGRTSWTVNAAEFNGEAALGGSIAHRFGNDERPFAVSAGFSHSGRESAFRVGMSGEF